MCGKWTLAAAELGLPILPFPVAFDEHRHSGGESACSVKRTSALTLSVLERLRSGGGFLDVLGEVPPSPCRPNNSPIVASRFRRRLFRSCLAPASPLPAWLCLAGRAGAGRRLEDGGSSGPAVIGRAAARGHNSRRHTAPLGVLGAGAESRTLAGLRSGFERWLERPTRGRQQTANCGGQALGSWRESERGRGRERRRGGA